MITCSYCNEDVPKGNTYLVTADGTIYCTESCALKDLELTELENSEEDQDE